MKRVKKSYITAITAVVTAFVVAVALCISVLRSPVAVFSQGQTAMKIVVDAGHGGIDAGVAGVHTGVKESDLNLEISLRLKEQLESLGFEVVLTRKTQTGLYGTTAKGFKKRDMEKRKEIVLEEKPTLLISIHQNKYPSKAQRGAQVFYNKSSTKGKAFALCLQERLNGLYKDQGVKPRKVATGDFFMLNLVDAPSVLIECGFLSSPLDEKLLMSESWQKALVENITDGVMAYLSDGVS